MTTTCTAFTGTTHLASGSPAEVALASIGRPDVLIFDDATGRQLDFDLRGTPEEIAARLTPAEAPRSPGRPRLGVVAREVTLLPRHWDWLAEQPGGASIALRKLVEAASRAPAPARARQAADRFMGAIAGNLPGYEEATRALYAGDRARFDQQTTDWPADIRDHALRLAAPGLDPAA